MKNLWLYMLWGLLLLGSVIGQQDDEDDEDETLEFTLTVEGQINLGGGKKRDLKLEQTIEVDKEDFIGGIILDDDKEEQQEFFSRLVPGAKVKGRLGFKETSRIESKTVSAFGRISGWIKIEKVDTDGELRIKARWGRPL
jgi:hypothetical protein